MKKVLGLIFCAYIIFFICLPPIQTPDELSHFELVYWTSFTTYPYINQKLQVNPYGYARELSELFNLGNEDPMLVIDFEKVKKSPLQQKIVYDSEKNGQLIAVSSQAYNPPLYYFFAHQLLRSARFFQINVIEQFYIVRLTSGIFFAGVLYFLYKTLTLCFKDKKVVSGVLLGMGINPLLLQSAVGISPDIAAMFFAVVFCYFFMRYRILTGISTIHLVNLAIIAGLGTLSKISNMTIVIAFAVYLFVCLKKNKKKIAALCIFVGTFVLTQLPWIYLNLVRYGKIVPEQVALGAIESADYTITWFKAAIVTLVNFRHTIMHYAGFLGQNDVYPFSFIFIPFVCIVLLLFCIGIFFAKKPRSFPSGFMLGVVLCSVCFFFGLGFLRMIQFHPGWGIGGRNVLYLYPIVSLYLFFGLVHLVKNNTLLAAKIWGYTGIFYFFYILVFVLWPRYYV